jgi:protease I
MRVAYLVDEGYEDLEFWVPFMRLQEEGAEVTVVGSTAGRRVKGKSGGLTVETEAAASDLSAEDFDALIIPGGWAPDKLRRDEGVKRLVSAIHGQGKIIGMICHAGLVGISAGIVQGHTATGSLGIKDDIENAGGTWVDDAAFQEGNLIWGRVVADIPDFCRELVRALSATS